MNLRGIEIWVLTTLFKCWIACRHFRRLEKKDRPLRIAKGWDALVLFAVLCGSASATATDMDKALALVPVSQTTTTAVQSGDWSASATWGGNLPATDGKVLIPANIAVVQDVSSPRLKWLRVDGQFSPKPGAALTLTVDTLVTTMGSKFWAGAQDSPFDGQWNIIFADYGPIDTVADPWLMGRGAQFMGEVSLHGRYVKPFCLTTGNKAGDAVVTLKSPCDGWKVGDRIVLPGTAISTSDRVPQIIDDDECTITNITPDKLSVTIGGSSIPLRFDHEAVDRASNPRPMFAANITRRSINFESENQTDFTGRGHIMVMSDKMAPVVFSYVSFIELGRTNKNLPLTDPDGQGGGLSNARGRYSLHFHKRGPDLDGMEGMVTGCLAIGSPGWQFTNHESYVCLTQNVGYHSFGPCFVGENGNESGCIRGNVAIRSVNQSRPQNAGIKRSNNDVGNHAHGVWTSAGGIQTSDNIVTGMNNTAYGFFGESTMTFEVKNIPPELIDVIPLEVRPPVLSVLVRPSEVPQRHLNNSCFGCRGGIALWGLGQKNAVVPRVGHGEIIGGHIECVGQVLLRVYLSHWLIKDVEAVHPNVDGSGIGSTHSGVDTQITMENCKFDGYGVGVLSPTMFVNAIKDCEFRCFTGISIITPTSGQWRNLQIDGCTFDRMTAAEMAAAQLTQQTDVKNHFQEGFVLDIFGKGPAGLAYFSSTVHVNDDRSWTKLDGKYLFYGEEGHDFPLSTIPQCPAIVAGLTNEQMWNQYGVVIGAKILPADAVKLPGSYAYISDSLPRFLPKMQIKKTGGLHGSYQQTNQISGYVARVKLEDGTFAESVPTNLTDKMWNIVSVNVAGEKRGVFVYADAASNPAANW